MIKPVAKTDLKAQFMAWNVESKSGLSPGYGIVMFIL